MVYNKADYAVGCWFMSKLRSGYGFNHYQPKKKRWDFFASIFSKKKPVIIHRTRIAQDSAPPFGNYRPAGGRIQARRSLRLYLGFFGGVFITWIGLMLYLPYFQITQVSYNGLSIIKKAELEPVVNEILTKHTLWPSNNFFLLNTKAIVHELKKTFALESVIIKKKFPGELLISIKEKISSLIYDNGWAYYLLDQNGSVLKELEAINQAEVGYIFASLNASSTDKSPTSTIISAKTTISHTPNFKEIQAEFGKYPILVDTRGATTSVSSTIVLPDRFIEGLIRLDSDTKNDLRLKANYFMMDDPYAGVTAVVNAPWRVRYAPAGDIAGQLMNLKIILRDSKPAEYVDVRFGQRIYWK